MKKLYRAVVILPEDEYQLLLKISKQMKLAKSRVFRIALAEYEWKKKHL